MLMILTPLLVVVTANLKFSCLCVGICFIYLIIPDWRSVAKSKSNSISYELLDASIRNILLLRVPQMMNC